MRTIPNHAGVIACGMAATLAFMLTSLANGYNMAELEEKVSKTFETGLGPRVVVETFNGSISVVGADTHNIQATVMKRGEGPDELTAHQCLANIDVSMRQDSEVVYVTARLRHSPRHGHAQAFVKMMVPSRAAVDLETDNGPIRIRDLKHSVTAKVNNGEIEVKGGTGVKIDLTTNGDVEVSETLGATVMRAELVNGSVRFQGSLDNGSHSFRSGNGGIELALPASSSFVIDAVSGNGRVINDFSIDEGGGHRRGRLSGIVGDQPNTNIRARTTNGKIRILRGTAKG